MDLCCAFAVLLQEMPSYNESRRSQTALVERQPSLLQRCRSNPQIYYGRAKTLSGINGSSTLLSRISCPQRRDAGLRGLYSALAPYRPPSSDVGFRHYDTDSLRSLSVSSASSFSGAFSVTQSLPQYETCIISQLPKLCKRMHPLPSNRQHLSYDVCLEVRGEIIRTVLCCIVY